MKKAIIHQHYPLDYAGEEALNSICTNLAFIGTDKRKIVITSNSQSEGKQSCECSYRCSDLSGKPRKSNGRNKMKKIWITGAEGHIGTALLDLLEGVEYQLLPTDIEEVDITKIDEVTQFVHVNRPDVVINCAAITMNQ